MNSNAESVSTVEQGAGPGDMVTVARAATFYRLEKEVVLEAVKKGLVRSRQQTAQPPRKLKEGEAPPEPKTLVSMHDVGVLRDKIEKMREEDRAKKAAGEEAERAAKKAAEAAEKKARNFIRERVRVLGRWSDEDLMNELTYREEVRKDPSKAVYTKPPADEPAATPEATSKAGA